MAVLLLDSSNLDIWKLFSSSSDVSDLVMSTVSSSPFSLGLDLRERDPCALAKKHFSRRQRDSRGFFTHGESVVSLLCSMTVYLKIFSSVPT